MRCPARARTLLLSVALGASWTLTGCNRQGGRDDRDSSLPSSSSERPEDRFGSSFAKAYRADPNSEPVVTRTNEMPPVNETAEPVEVN